MGLGSEDPVGCSTYVSLLVWHQGPVADEESEGRGVVSQDEGCRRRAVPLRLWFMGAQCVQYHLLAIVNNHGSRIARMTIGYKTASLSDGPQCDRPASCRHSCDSRHFVVRAFVMHAGSLRMG